MECEPTDLFSALADATRLRCLMLLAKAPSLCVCELMDALQEPQPKLSKHLGVLRELGLVSDERKAQWVHYSLRNDLPGWVKGIINAALEGAGDQEPFASDAKRLRTSLDGCRSTAFPLTISKRG